MRRDASARARHWGSLPWPSASMTAADATALPRPRARACAVVSTERCAAWPGQSRYPAAAMIRSSSWITNARGTDLGDPALGEITSARSGQEPPECEARGIKACTGGLARCRAEIGGIKVGQESRAENVGDDELAAEDGSICHRGRRHGAESSLHGLPSVLVGRGSNGGARDDDKTCPTRRAQTRTERHNHANDRRESNRHASKALPDRAGPQDQCGQGHDPEDTRNEPCRCGQKHPVLTATVTATTATNGRQRRPTTAQNTRTIYANWEICPASLARGRRAISVQLTRVMRGRSRLLTVSEVGCSAALSAAICPISKLIVRVRFLSPVLRRSGGHDAVALRATGYGLRPVTDLEVLDRATAEN